MSLVHRPHGIYITVHTRRCKGHAVRTSVSTTCSLHLTVPPLVDGCAVWLGIRNLLNFSSKVLSSACATSQSLGRLKWGYFPITWDTAPSGSIA